MCLSQRLCNRRWACRTRASAGAGLHTATSYNQPPIIHSRLDRAPAEPVTRVPASAFQTSMYTLVCCVGFFSPSMRWRCRRILQVVAHFSAAPSSPPLFLNKAVVSTTLSITISPPLPCGAYLEVRESLVCGLCLLSSRVFSERPPPSVALSHGMRRGVAGSPTPQVPI